MEPIDIYLLQFRRQTREAFLATLTDPVLVMRLPVNESSSEWTGFQTNTVQFDKAAVTKLWTDAERKVIEQTDGLFVMKIVKSATNPWRGRISLGRARNNDLVVPDASISKLHAHFTIKAEEVNLVDARSHNGTKIGGRLLGENESVSLKSGDKIEFGDIPATFYTPLGLVDILSSLFVA